jgi:hypothetical protein
MKTTQQGQVFHLESNKDVRAAASSFLSECGHEAIAVVSFDEAHELAKPIIPSKSLPGKTSFGAFPSNNVPVDLILTLGNSSSRETSLIQRTLLRQSAEAGHHDVFADL